MKKVFIDTNIFIDLIMKREDFLLAARVLSYANKSNYSLHASILTMANISYILRKAIGIEHLYSELEKFNSLIEIEPMTQEDYKKCLKLKAKDFEDALQYTCALSSGCSILVTRNKKDFQLFKGIKICTPDEFLKEYA